MISRDPLRKPDLPDEVIRLARERGQKLVIISLVERRPTVENPMIEGQSFWAVVDFLPRKDEYIRTQNGKVCKVTGVHHFITPYESEGKTAAFTLVPTVFALLNEKDAEEDGTDE